MLWMKYPCSLHTDIPSTLCPCPHPLSLSLAPVESLQLRFHSLPHHHLPRFHPIQVLDRIKSGNGWNQGNEGFDGGDEFDGSTVEGAVSAISDCDRGE